MDLAEMKSAHETLAELVYEPRPVERGYAGQTLYVNLTENRIEIKPVTQYMKDVFTGGKGFDLYLMWHAISGPIAWDDPENEIVICTGPLGGSPAFSGTSKSIVTGISPTTGSVIDSNVGGHFGPLLKFAGFDALELQGKASEEVIVVVDGKRQRVSIETAPHEAVNSYELSEQLHHMYADSPDELQSISSVSAGKGAEHTLIGCLNFSFYDYRRDTPRLKQAGRGGLGTVLRNKKIKGLVAKAPHNRPRWQMSVRNP
ncbi:MAG: aldehyde ferredoxin oxidoreductase N-terminal domain-containing protein [bacterium]